MSEAEDLLANHADTGKLNEWHANAARKLHLSARRPQASQALSDAERRILRLLASDLSLSEIGRELFLSTNTVRTHKRAIYRKLGVSSRNEAVKSARLLASSADKDSPGVNVRI